MNTRAHPHPHFPGGGGAAPGEGGVGATDGRSSAFTRLMRNAGQRVQATVASVLAARDGAGGGGGDGDVYDAERAAEEATRRRLDATIQPPRVGETLVSPHQVILQVK